jgi:hypothetical protein
MISRRTIQILAVVAFTVVALVAAGGIYLSHANRQSAISAATKWARLAPLPSSAQNIKVDVKGSMFTREFRITFGAPSAVIEQWIAASPGPSSATQSTVGSVTTYAITPGGGAQFAEVKVDASTNRVVIRTYWS